MSVLQKRLEESEQKYQESVLQKTKLQDTLDVIQGDQFSDIARLE